MIIHHLHVSHQYTYTEDKLKGWLCWFGLENETKHVTTLTAPDRTTAAVKFVYRIIMSVDRLVDVRLIREWRGGGRRRRGGREGGEKRRRVL